MVALFIDGFDKYGPVGFGGAAQIGTQPYLQGSLQQEWTVCGSSSMMIAAPLSATGGSLSLNNSNYSYVRKTLAANYSTLIAGVRFNLPLGTIKPGIVFLDNGSVQCSIVWNSSGTISIYNGDNSGGLGGTLIATSTVSVSANSTHYLECQVTFGASASYQIWLDGVSILSGSGNTKTTSNSYANQISLGCTSTGGANGYFDDFYCFDTSGSTCNAPLLTNPHIETQFPSGDSQTQFTNNASIIGQDVMLSSSQSGYGPGANLIFARPFTSAVNQTLNSISCLPSATNGSANFKPVLFGPVPAVTAHRYWRVYINTVAAGQPAQINEIQFRTTPGTALAFSGGTTSASSVSSSYVAANAIDGSTSTYWLSSTTGGGSWWQYDYGAGNSINVAEVYLYDNNTYGISSFDLQYSDDGTNFYTVMTCTPNLVSNIFSPLGQTFDVSSRPTTAGSPGSPLLAMGPAVTGCTSGVLLTLPFSTGQSLIAGASYAFGWLSDTSINFWTVDGSFSALSMTQTYSASAPLCIVGSNITTGVRSYMVYGNCTGATTNYESEDLALPVGTASTIISSTAGNEDLYTYPNIVTAAPVIYTMAVKAYASKSDSGTRTITMQTKSGSTDSSGSLAATAPATTFQWMDSFFSTDPNTGSAWTSTGLNAAVSGPKVAS